MDEASAGRRDPQRQTDRERGYGLFAELYRGRQDRIGLRRDGKYYPVAGGLSFGRFCEHLDLTNTYGLYSMDDEGRVGFGLFDFDVLPRKQEWPQLLAKLGEERDKSKRLIAWLLEQGIDETSVLVEFPTVGYHILLFFDEPLPAHAVRTFMRSALDACGLSETPSYPKTVDPGGPGDLIQLPFRLNRNSGKRSNLVRDLNAFEPETYDPEPDFAPLETVSYTRGALILDLAARSLTKGAR